MKKIFYLLMAFLYVTNLAIAQNNTTVCNGRSAFQVTVNGRTASFFSIQSVNVPLLHMWSFGDGAISDAANPVHTYQQNGTYRVWHYIKINGTTCRDSSFKDITIQQANACDLLQPKFEWMRDSANQARIIFINQTLPNPPPAGLQYAWSFGDGTSSAEKNPVHVYSTPGLYIVCLTAKLPGTNCQKIYCDTVIVSSSCNLQPNFTWAADSSHPLRLKFTNLTPVTVNNTQVRWTFGDGSSSTELNPVHIYAQPGIYTVCLKVMINNTCIKEICKQVIVRACNIEPNFSWSTDTIYPLRGVQFHNLTPLIANIPPTAVRWTFGDGTSSSEWSPFHKYEQPGTYTVCLKIEFFQGCVKQVCKTIVIPVPVNCERLSDFKYAPTHEPGTFKFEANVNNTSLKYVWTFGDGTGAFTPNTGHTYNRPGKYTVCLTVYRGENCASTTCKEIVVGPLNCQQTIVKFEYQRLNPPFGNIIKFTAVGNQPIISQRWTITKDSIGATVILNTTNPTYTFTQTGLYKVCLRAITANGCVKEYCEYIRINSVQQQCTLQVTPNPATIQISFRVELPQPMPVITSIIDAQGVRRAIFYLAGTQGNNSFTLPVGNLPAGYYTLEVKVGDRICQGRFQKVN
jgi:PKD repeat protein